MDCKLTLCTWNANGLTNKTDILNHFLTDNNIDILTINETKLTKNKSIKFVGYHVVRQDRPGDIAAGGVAMLIKKHIIYRQINNKHSNIEHVIIKLKSGPTIIGAYNPPNNNITTQDLDTLFNTDNRTLLLGDLNSRHNTWNCHRQNRNGHTLRDYTDINNIQIHNTDTPTHYPENGMTPTTIDLILTKNLPNITNPESLPQLDSDHNPVLFHLSTNNSCLNPFSNYKTLTSCKHTDWTAFRKTLDTNITITNQIITTDDIDRQVSLLTKAFTTAKNKHTETVITVPAHELLPTHILELITQKHKARKLWQRTNDPTYRTEKNRLTALNKRLIKAHRNTQWLARIQALKPSDNTLWKMSKLLKTNHPPIPSFSTSNTPMSDLEKAETLANTFNDIQTHDPHNNPEQQSIHDEAADFLFNTHPDPSLCLHLYTTPTEIKNILKSLPTKKAPGPDKLENIILKNSSKKSIVQLHYIINAIIRLSYFPKAWKSSIIIPIPKPAKDHTNPANFRPISLISTLAKITEKVILSRIHDLDLHHELTSDHQFGFRPGLGTTHQILRLVTDISINYNQSKNTALLLLDLKNAFDKVWHKGLIHKLISLQVDDHLIKLIDSYLSNRTFTVKINNTHSTPKTATAGVPQGSVLAPKLFNIFLNDIPPFPNTKLGLYADDTAIYSHSFYAIAANKQIQIHADILNKYFEKWKITLNPLKTENVIFTKKFTNNETVQLININGHRIPTTPSAKYLGVTLDARLTYNQHFKNVIARAYSVTNKLYPLLARNNGLKTKTKTLLYKVVIRPIITYAAPVWQNASKTAKTRLQRYQNKCLRLTTDKDRYTKITDLHRLASIPTIDEYIYHISEKFYRHKLNNNRLTADITKIRRHNAPYRLKHKLPYQNLTIFNEQE